MSKKWLVSIMATMLACSVGLFAGCFLPQNPTESSSSTSSEEEVRGTLKLNVSTAFIDVYDTMQLTATKEHLDGDVVWSSSNESIATVDQNGLVSAWSEGKVTITASVGDVKATCEITASISDVSPVMSVTMETIQIKKGETFDVEVVTTWKDKEITNAVYEWYLLNGEETSDIVSISVSEDGKTATFTGLTHGTESYCVSTVVNGIPLVKTITIASVDNAVTFEIANISKNDNGYATKLSLVEIEGHVASVVPEVTVYYHGEEQTLNVDWTMEDPTVATIENGAIVGLKAGNTIANATVEIGGTTGVLNIAIEVYAPEFTYTVDEPKEIDLNGDVTLALGDIASKLNAQASLKEVKIGENILTASYENGVIHVDTASIGNVYGNVEFTAEFNAMKGDAVACVEKVTIPVTAYRSLSSKEEMLQLGNYLQMEGTAAYGDFRVTADIDMGGEEFVAIGGYTSGVGWSHVFHGTFDGQNHVISNVVMTGSDRGLFCAMNGSGIIKNLTFMNVEFNGAKAKTGLLLTDMSGGVIENVFVYGKFTNLTGNKGIPSAMLVSKHSAGTIKDCFVVVENSSLTEHGGMLCGWSNGTVENCVAINLSGTKLHAIGTANIAIPDQTEAAGESVKVYNSFAEYYADETNYTFDDNAKAVIEKYKAVFTNAEAEKLILTDVKTEIEKEGSMQLKPVGAYLASMSLKTAVPGVTLENGVLYTDATVKSGTAITIVLKGVFGTEKEYTIVVCEETIDVSIADVLEYDASKNVGAVIDLSDYITEDIQGIRVATVGGVEVEGVTFEGKKVTIPNDVLVDGEAANVITFIAETQEAVVTVDVSVIKITKVIMNTEDLNWFGAYSNQFENKYYVLGADIEYSGTYSAATGIWSNNIFDGRGHVINNFATDTSLIGVATSDGSLYTTTVVKNVIFTNAKTVVDNKAIVIDYGSYTLRNIYVSVAADTATNTSAVWRSQRNNVAVQGIVAEYLGTTAERLSELAYNGRYIFRGVYGINVTTFDANDDVDWVEGEDKNYKADVYGLYPSWNDFVAIEEAAEFFDTSFWTITNGIPMPKTLSFGFVNNETEKVDAGNSYRIDHKGYANVSINEVAGVTLENGMITVAENVAAGTKITITITSVATDSRATKEISVLANTIINAETLDFDLNNKTISSVKLTDETLNNVIVEWNGSVLAGATFENGVLTLTNGMFGQGANDWGMQQLVIKGEAETGRVTINIPVLAYKSVTDIKSLETVGYTATANGGITTQVFGYFKLTSDFDATGWEGNGTYTTKPTYQFYGTLDGQYHVISNYSAGAVRGLFFANHGTIKNLVLTNAEVASNSGIVAHHNYGIIENVYVEGKITHANNRANSAGMIASSLHSYSVIKNCVVVLTGSYGTNNQNQAMVAGYFGTTTSTVQNCLGINVTGNTVYMVARPSAAAIDVADVKEYADETNKVLAWSDIAAYSNHWAYEYLKAYEEKSMSITAEKTTVSMGESVQLSCAFAKSWSLETPIEGVSVDKNGVVTATLNAAKDASFTVVATGVCGNTATFTMTVAQPAEIVLTAAEVDFDLKNASVTTAQFITKEVANVSITWKGNAVVGATFDDGKLTLPNTAFGQGTNDWGALTIVVTADMDGCPLTINVPILVYKSVTDIKSLETVGYTATANGGVTTQVFGYFKLTSDFDATGWEGNGTYTTKPTYQFYGTLDGQYHVISNYSAGAVRGLFFANHGTIKNLVLTNAEVASNSGIVAHQNYGIIENVYVEGKITHANNRVNSAGMIASSLHSYSVIKNCVVVLTGSYGTNNQNQAMVAGYFGTTTSSVQNCLGINLSGNTMYMVARPSATAIDAADVKEYADETNKVCNSWAEYETALSEGLTLNENALAFINAIKAKA